jgi:hypothetical protein
MNCYLDYSLTSTDGYLDKKSPYLTFRLSTPTAPTTIITAKVKLSFTEFLIYLTSSFGTWFGVSVMKMNPLGFRFVQRFLQKSSDKRNKIQDGVSRTRPKNPLVKAGSLTNQYNTKYSRENIYIDEEYRAGNSHSLWRHYPLRQISPWELAQLSMRKTVGV